MSEYAAGSVQIDASPWDVMEVITDYESYPDWTEVASAEIRVRGQGGLPSEVAYEVDVPFLGTASYTLAYVYAGDQAVSWSTKEARGAVRDIRGEYLLRELDDDRTEVTYRLAVDLGVLVPGFVRTQGSQRVIENALEKLKARVEGR
ncbi:MAG: SRPBCC family protein [Actinomycetota bacterium]